MWGSLLHEMVHAYLNIYSQHQFSTSIHKYDSHGEHFQRCLIAVNGRAEREGLGLEGAFLDWDWTVGEKGRGARVLRWLKGWEGYWGDKGDEWGGVWKFL